MSREYQKKNPVLVVDAAGGVKVERSGYQQERLTITLGGGGGMIKHGNEWHVPHYTDVFHRHTGSDGTSQIDHSDLINVTVNQHHTHHDPINWTFNGSTTQHTLGIIPIVAPIFTMEGRTQILNVDFSIDLNTGIITMLRHTAGQLQDFVCQCDNLISAAS